jgi:hypothetical protein
MTSLLPDVPSRTDSIDAMDGCKLYEGPDGVSISLIARWDHVEAHCHGDACHFREDGGCEHMDELLAVQKPGRDVRVLPFGGRS